MSQYLIPLDKEFVEEVAKAIARDRLHQDASDTLYNMVGMSLDSPDYPEITLDKIFDRIWSNNSPSNEKQKEGFRQDARAAIRAINLKLLISPD